LRLALDPRDPAWLLLVKGCSATRGRKRPISEHGSATRFALAAASSERPRATSHATVDFLTDFVNNSTLACAASGNAPPAEGGRSLLCPCGKFPTAPPPRPPRRVSSGPPVADTPASAGPHCSITRPGPGCTNAPTTTEDDHANTRAFDIRETVWSQFQAP